MEGVPPSEPTMGLGRASSALPAGSGAESLSKTDFSAFQALQPAVEKFDVKINVLSDVFNEKS